MNSTVKTALLWVVIIVLVFLLWSLFNTAKGASEQIPFSRFMDRVTQGSVDFEMSGRQIESKGELDVSLEPALAVATPFREQPRMRERPALAATVPNWRHAHTDVAAQKSSELSGYRNG